MLNVGRGQNRSKGMDKRVLKSFSDRLFRQAISNLLKRREYHTATPIKKREMLYTEMEMLCQKNKEIQRRAL